MGGSQMKRGPGRNQYAMLEITQDQNYFLAGEEITGTVSLTIYHNFALEALQIKLLGTESFTLLHNRNESKIVEEARQLDAADYDSELKQARAKILRMGKYPYNFSIPTQGVLSMPPTAQHNRHNLQGKIYYVLIATLKSATPGISPLTVTEEVGIANKVKSTMKMNKSNTSQIKTATTDYGSGSITVRLDLTAIVVPLGFEVYIDYDNRDCSLDVKHVDAVIKERVTAHIAGAKKDLVEEMVLGKWRLGGVAKGEKEFYNSRLRFKENDITREAQSAVGSRWRRDYHLIIAPVYSVSGLIEPLRIEIPVFLSNRVDSRLKHPPQPADLPMVNEMPSIHEADPQAATFTPIHPSLSLALSYLVVEELVSVIGFMLAQ